MAKPKAQDAASSGGREPRQTFDPGWAISRARVYAKSRGIQFTDTRERVLMALVAAARPLTAYEIAHSLSDAKKVVPIQVYRALDFLQQAGCVQRIDRVTRILFRSRPGLRVR